MAAFDYRQATEIRDAFARNGVRYLFLGKSGAILLGFPDTTQNVVLFAEKSPSNGRAILAALRDYWKRHLSRGDGRWGACRNVHPCGDRLASSSYDEVILWSTVL